MLPLHRKEKLDDAKQLSFPYKFVRPAMFSKPRRRLSPRQVHVGGFLILSILLWLIFLRGGDGRNRYKSPYALTSQRLSENFPIVDVTIQECTRWRWFEGRSKCTRLVRDGWEISGGDLLLDTEKNRVHLFIKREIESPPMEAIVDLRISRERPGTTNEGWESRPGGIWIKRSRVTNVRQAVTAIDFIHGKDVRELRRGRQFVVGGPLHLKQQHVNLSYRIGLLPPREFPILKITTRKPYKVLQIADVHLSTGVAECRDVVSEIHKEACEADSTSLNFVKYILDQEKPDFVALTGDQVNGDNAPNTKSAFFKLAELLIDRKIPYAAIFGNHDDEGDMSREELMNLLTEMPYCVSKPGLSDIAGVGNFVVLVEKPESTEVAIALWFLDTHKYSPNERKYHGYDWLKENQIEWFKSQFDELAPWPRDSLQAAFIHIPLTEYRTITNAFIGGWREGPTAPRYNSGFRTALAEKNIMVITAGHDHANDYCMLDEMSRNRQEKTWMCYGGGVGYGGYGGYGGYTRRLRLFEFDNPHRRITTWKRVDEDTNDPMARLARVEQQVLVDEGKVSTTSLDVEIEGMNMTLAEYFEAQRPPDLPDLTDLA